MKRMLAAVLLLISGLIYVIAAVTQKGLYLQKFSIEADNPVSFDGYSIKIDTNFQNAGQDAVYHLSLVPIYLIVLTALALTIWAFFKKKY